MVFFCLGILQSHWRMAGWTLWQGSSLLPVNIMGCYKVITSSRHQDSGIYLSQLLDTSLVWLDSQHSFCPRLIDRTDVFQFASSTNSKYSRDPHRVRGNTYMPSLKHKNFSNTSHYPLLGSFQMINLWPESLGLCHCLCYNLHNMYVPLSGFLSLLCYLLLPLNRKVFPCDNLSELDTVTF